MDIKIVVWTAALAILPAATGAFPAAVTMAQDRFAESLKPLPEILAEAGRRYTGQIIASEVKPGKKHEHAPVVYEIRLLTDQGNVIRIRFDAATGEFLGADGRGLVGAQRK